MTMHTVFFKEHEGGAGNSSNGATSAAPWWTRQGSQLQQLVAHCEPFVPSKLATLELCASRNLLNPAKEPEDDHQGLAKGNAAQFALLSDIGFNDHRTTEKRTPVQTLPSVKTANVEYLGHFELGFGQPLICAKYPYAEQCYGVNLIYGTQTAGRIMLPLSMRTDGGPIFVNAKQYNGIMRRRKKRAMAEMVNKVVKLRKPYLHLSRHLHATRRPRGNGGRFLNTRTSNGSIQNTAMKKADGEKTQLQQGTGSQISEVVQSAGGRSTSPGSEVTSHPFSRANPFCIDRLHPSIQPFSNVANTGLGIAMASGDYLKV